MDWSGSREGTAGYATATAAIVSLGLSLVVAAVMAAALVDLRTARADFARQAAEYELDGLQQAAAVAVLADGRGRRLRWRMASSLGEIEVLAEPEAAKIAPGTADGEVARLLGVEASESAAFSALRPGRALSVETLDDSVPWRECAAAILSPYGRAPRPMLQAAERPVAGRFSWRVGEVWRLRAASSGGWGEERIVRMTGLETRPAAVIERRLLRAAPWGERCTHLIDAS